MSQEKSEGVNKDIIHELYENAGETRIQKGRLYAKIGRVEIEKIYYENEKSFEITGKVKGQDVYRTHIGVENGEIEDITCECIDYQNRYATCKHIIATMIEFNENPKYEQMHKTKENRGINKKITINSKYRSFKQIVNEFYTEEMQEIEASEKNEEKHEKIKIEPKRKIKKA